MADFSVVTVLPDWVLEDEPMGSKDKFWVQVPNDLHPWLFKYSRVNAGVVTGEHWSEKLAAEFAALLCVPHARVKLACFKGAYGSLSRSFDALADPAVELVHGNELLAGIVDGYDQKRRWGQHQHTLSNILHVVSELMDSQCDAREEAFQMVGSFVVLDALILNTDRHHENWAMFRENRPGGRVRYRLAPSFDHASSLGRELTDDKLAAWAKECGHVARYAGKGHGGVFLKGTERRGANPLVLAEVAKRRWPRYLEYRLERLCTLGITPFLAAIDRVPECCMSTYSRQFVGELVRYTHGRLQELI